MGGLKNVFVCVYEQDDHLEVKFLASERCTNFVICRWVSLRAAKDAVHHKSLVRFHYM